MGRFLVIAVSVVALLSLPGIVLANVDAGLLAHP
jgi:hypothetical protein